MQCERVSPEGARCDSGAQWGATFAVDCPEPGQRRRVNLKLNTKVCDAHREAVKGYLLEPVNRENIALALADAGFHEPDWSTLKVDFAPLVTGPIASLSFCSRAGCQSVATWRIRQRFPKKGYAATAWRAMTNIVVCDEHKEETTAADFKDADSRRQIIAMLKQAGVKGLDLSRMEVEFVPLGAAPTFESGRIEDQQEAAHVV